MGHCNHNLLSSSSPKDASYRDMTATTALVACVHRTLPVITSRQYLSIKRKGITANRACVLVAGFQSRLNPPQKMMVNWCQFILTVFEHVIWSGFFRRGGRIQVGLVLIADQGNDHATAFISSASVSDRSRTHL